MLKPTLLLFFLVLILPLSSLAQQEAQAGEEVLKLQNIETEQVVRIRTGDRVKIPRSGQDGRRVLGTVTELNQDGFVVKDIRRKEDYVVDLNQEKLIYIRQLAGQFALGVILTVLGSSSLAIISFVALIISIIIALGGSTGPLLGLWVSLLIAGLLLGLGIWLITKSRKKILPKMWRWKLLKQIFIPGKR